MIKETDVCCSRHEVSLILVKGHLVCRWCLEEEDNRKQMIADIAYNAALGGTYGSEE